MKDKGRPPERPRQIDCNHSQGNRRRGGVPTWAEVDRELEVRARIVVALDAIEDGDVRMAELCLFQILDDLDAAPEILRAA
jgi:hypothetical protein